MEYTLHTPCSIDQVLVYTFSYFGHDWKLIVLKGNNCKFGKIDDYYVQLQDYSLIQHVIGWPQENPDLQLNDLDPHIKCTCRDYCSTLDMIEGW